MIYSPAPTPAFLGLGIFALLLPLSTLEQQHPVSTLGEERLLEVPRRPRFP